ncbi:hypothetical protein D9M71_747980 [compost metagenome]
MSPKLDFGNTSFERVVRGDMFGRRVAKSGKLRHVLALQIGATTLLIAIVHRRVQHLHHIINDRLAHILQKMRRPGMPIGIANHGRVCCEQLGNVE